MHNLCENRAHCENCAHKANGSITFHSMNIGEHTPKEKCTQNYLIFVLSGNLLVNSAEYPGTEIHAGQFILQAIGSKLELLALTSVRFLIYRFTKLPIDCDYLYSGKYGENDEPLTYSPLNIIPKLYRVLEEIKEYVEDNITKCQYFLDLKCKELVFILLSYYPRPQVSAFFYPISSYTQDFHYFILQNFDKIKNVEEFAHLGGYNIASFRRMFKNLYGIPVYEWILQQKREGILMELQQGNGRLNAISAKYGFESPSHFAHFCKSSFGDTPRNIRKRSQKGEIFNILASKKTPSANEDNPTQSTNRRKASRPRKKDVQED